MYIKDLGLNPPEIRPYGSNHHDALRISLDGRMLSYENLQNGEGSKYGCYRFCDAEGKTPKEDPDFVIYGADAYFNIGGFMTSEEEEILKLYYDMSKSMQKAVKNIMLVANGKEIADERRE